MSKNTNSYVIRMDWFSLSVKANIKIIIIKCYMHEH